MTCINASDEFNPLCHNCPDVSICCNLRLADTPAGTCASSHVADDLSQNWSPCPRHQTCGEVVWGLEVYGSNLQIAWFFFQHYVFGDSPRPCFSPPPGALAAVVLDPIVFRAGQPWTFINWPIERASHRKHSQILTSFSRHTHTCRKFLNGAQWN